jgi:Tol biopolymer transport system component/predicted amidohydrolase
MEVVPSPDGRRLALQVWQQIWILDVAGGEARRVTNAVNPSDEHWFPRWSPDGRAIVFSSLRPGVGLSVVPDSGGPRRRLTGGPFDWWPSWSPDASTIVLWRATPGGLWTIRSSGGDPQRLTPDTLDAEKPAWSPDGRWIAFNSHGRLYVITPDGASIRQLTAGPEDQAPSWAPTSRDLFFLSGRSGHRQIWSVGVDGGEPRLIVDDEDIHSYAPHWLPGRNVLVYAAAGRIRTFDPATGARDSIPFRARLSLARVTYKRSRPPIAPPGARVRVRGISRLAPSPDGSRIVFAALGDLWLREANGRIRPLTSGPADDKDPAWSRDSRRITFVSNEEGEYQVFVVDLDTGARRRVTNNAGPAESPVWQANGDSIVFVYRGALRAVSANGGPSRVLVQPQAVFAVRPLAWSAEAGLVYSEYRFSPQTATFATRVMRLAGGEPEPLLTQQPAGQLDFVAMSPDSRHLALVDRGELRIRSLPPDSGERVLPGPAAFFPSWAGDRHIVYLSGGELRRVDVQTGEDRRVPVDLSYIVPRPGSTLLLRNARLLTPEPRQGLWDLLLADGEIRLIRPSNPGAPAADSVVDVGGRSVMPGLIDVHGHIFPRWFPAEGHLYWGVTSVGDAGGEGHEAVELKETIESGRLAGPRIFPAGGFVVNSEMNAFPQFLRVDTPAQLERYLDHLAGLGATQVKAYGRRNPWVEAGTVRAAHRRGLPALSHFIRPADVAAGLDRKEHAFYEAWTGDAESPYRQDVLEILRQARMTLTTTLVAAFSQTSDGGARIQASLSDSAVSSFLVPSTLASVRRRLNQPAQQAASWARTLRAMQANIAAARASDVTLAAGTDQSDIPVSLHWELELLVAAGLSPLDALRAATRGAATVLGVDGHLGSITEGATADLVVVEGDPLSDIRNTQRIYAVVKGGQVLDRRALLANARRRLAAQGPSH